MAAAGAAAAAVVKPKAAHTATMIFLHGLGDSGHGWRDACEYWARSAPHVKFVCPHAAPAPVTLNGGMRMPSWHDIKSLEKIDAEDYKGLPESRQLIEALLEREIEAGIPSDRIVVGGFSQGAAMSSVTTYQFSKKLAGMVALSGYLPFNGQFKTVIAAANAQTPALVCHGTADGVVNFKAGVNLYETLRDAGVPVEMKTYKGMGHSACQEELADVGAFLAKVIP